MCVCVEDRVLFANVTAVYENSLFQVYMQASGVVCKEWTVCWLHHSSQMDGSLIATSKVKFLILYKSSFLSCG